MLMRTRYLPRLGGTMVSLKKSQSAEGVPKGKQPVTGLEMGTAPLQVAVVEPGEMVPPAGVAAKSSGASSPVARRREAMRVLFMSFLFLCGRGRQGGTWRRGAGRFGRTKSV